MSKLINAALMVVGAFTGSWWLFAAGLQNELQGQAQRRAERRARDAYNASLTDRLEMVDLQPNAPRTMPLGRLRYVEGVRRRWSSGANSEKLTMVVSFGGVQIDGYEQWWLDDKPVTLDASGWVQDEPYAKFTRFSAAYTFASGGDFGTDGDRSMTVQLPHTPVAGSVYANWMNSGGVRSETPLQPSVVSGANVTFSALPAGVTVSVEYQWSTYQSTVRIRAFTGAPGQNLATLLVAEYPGKVASTDRFEGVAVAVVDVLYDPDVFPQGRPNVTATLRGALMYDPRKDSTQPGGSGSHRVDNPSTWEWSQNSALCSARYATWRHGFDLPHQEVSWSDVFQAAAQCDVATNFSVRDASGATTTVTLPRYQCGMPASSAADPRQTMAAILETMAGRDGWAGGVWRLRAGGMASPVFTLEPSWLAVPLASDGGHDQDPVIRFSSGVAPADKVNRVSGTCTDPDQRWQQLPFPAVEDPVLIAQQGEYATEVAFEGVNSIVHAQHLGHVMIRENQASLRAEMRCNLNAYRCELFDVGTLHLPRYGMTPELAKTAEVVSWRWHPREGIHLQLAEITEAIFEPVAQLEGRDPAPNSTIPAPGLVEDLAITSITSGTQALLDGSIVTRTQVEWTPAVADALRKFGRIELQYRLAGDTAPGDDWPSQMEGGGNTVTTVVGLLSDRDYVFRVRGVKPQVGVNGPWSVQQMHRVARPPSAAAYNLVARGSCVVSGSTIEKVGGSGAWNSDAYSAEAHAGGAYMSFRPARTDKYLFMGLSVDPVTSTDPEAIDYAWYCSAEAGPVLRVYERGVGYYNFGTFSAQTRLAIQYDGAVVTYLKDGQVVKTTAAPANLVLRLDSGFLSDGAKAVEVVFGPMGPRGAPGLQGEQGLAGAPGSDGQTSYFHVAFAENASGTAGFNHVGGTFIGTYTDFIQADSNNPGNYIWRLFKGTQGEQGIPGTNGANGQTSYLHLKYSNDGGTTFTSNNGEDVGAWLGQYVDFTSADSGSPSAYTWKKIEGSVLQSYVDFVAGPVSYGTIA